MVDKEIHEYFTALDWGVLIGYLLLTTLVGHLMKGKQASIRDFFLGGRSLPWLAVCGSIIATEISGVTFIGVPGGVLAANGDFTYLLWAIGSLIGRVLVAIFFVKVYYEEEIYSPYDYMGRRLGHPMKVLATVIFTLGSILAQSVRVLVAALPLMVVTGLSFEVCIVIIGVFAVIWTLMGGMQTVIWTDVMQFLLFTVGGLLSVWWISGHVDGGFSHILEVGQGDGKTALWDDRWGFGKELNFTIWVALLAVPFLNLTAFGVDQLNAQRMFCCRDVRAARKAIIWSSVGQLVTMIMLLVGVALYVFYKEVPPTGSVADVLKFDADMVPRGKEGTNIVFPVWIVTQLPPGLAGLILAGLFAAAISSLDSILAALSQTSLSLFMRTDHADSEEHGAKLMVASKALVVIWGVLLTGFTLALRSAQGHGVEILPLAFGMTTYTMGPMLAFMVAALTGRGSFRGLLAGAVVSIIIAAFWRTDIWIFFKGNAGLMEWLAGTWALEMDDSGEMVRSVYSYVWLWPLTAIITFVSGLVGRALSGRAARAKI